MTLWVIFFVPETRRVPIEEVTEIRIGRHWFWSKLIAGSEPLAGYGHRGKDFEMGRDASGLWSDSPASSASSGSLQNLPVSPRRGSMTSEEHFDELSDAVVLEAHERRTHSAPVMKANDLHHVSM